MTIFFLSRLFSLKISLVDKFFKDAMVHYEEYAFKGGCKFKFDEIIKTRMHGKMV